LAKHTSLANSAPQKAVDRFHLGKYPEDMIRLVATALVTALVGGIISAMLNLGAAASDCLLAVAILLTVPFALGVGVRDVRGRSRR